MKLYFSPGACSFSPHVVLRESGLSFDLVKVDLATKKTAAGEDYLAKNPKGYVPALELDDGAVLTEGPAIVQYVADQRPESKLAPPAGTLERYRLIEWLNYIGTELHKRYTPLFDRNASEEAKAPIKEALGKRIAFADAALAKHPYLLGDTFTAADAYLFTVIRWSKTVKLDLAPWPNVVAFQERVGERASVKAAIEAERALK